MDCYLSQLDEKNTHFWQFNSTFSFCLVSKNCFVWLEKQKNDLFVIEPCSKFILTKSMCERACVCESQRKPSCEQWKTESQQTDFVWNKNRLRCRIMVFVCFTLCVHLQFSLKDHIRAAVTVLYYINECVCACGLCCICSNWFAFSSFCSSSKIYQQKFFWTIAAECGLKSGLLIRAYVQTHLHSIIFFLYFINQQRNRTIKIKIEWCWVNSWHKTLK